MTPDNLFRSLLVSILDREKGNSQSTIQNYSKKNINQCQEFFCMMLKIFFGHLFFD